jgi:hypothetical protein
LKRIILLVILLSTLPAALATEIGAGYNNDIISIYNGLIAKSGVPWVRGFVNVQRNYLEFDDPNPTVITGVRDANITQTPDPVSGNADVLAIAAMAKLVQLKSVKVNDEPVKVILTMKMDFKYGCVKSPPPAISPVCVGVPAVGTPAAAAVRTAIHERLESENIGKYVDILVLDNEPMFETPDTGDEADKYGKLLNVIVADLVDLRATKHWSFQIFAGALNQPSANPDSPILKAVLVLVKSNNDVDGLDLHLHVGSLQEAANDLRFIRETSGITKKLISTEFSMIGLWDTWKDKALTSGGKGRDCPDGTLLRDWISTLLARAQDGDPIKGDAFLKCFKAQSWYPDHWFKTFVDIMRAHDVSVATYGMQSTPLYPAPVLTKDSALWVLNFVFNGSLLGLGNDGFYNTNPLVYPDFKEAIRQQSKP